MTSEQIIIGRYERLGTTWTKRRATHGEYRLVKMQIKLIRDCSWMSLYCTAHTYTVSSCKSYIKRLCRWWKWLVIIYMLNFGRQTVLVKNYTYAYTVRLHSSLQDKTYLDAARKTPVNAWLRRDKTGSVGVRALQSSKTRYYTFAELHCRSWWMLGRSSRGSLRRPAPDRWASSMNQDPPGVIRSQCVHTTRRHGGQRSVETQGVCIQVKKGFVSHIYWRYDSCSCVHANGRV